MAASASGTPLFAMSPHIAWARTPSGSQPSSKTRTRATDIVRRRAQARIEAKALELERDARGLR